MMALTLLVILASSLGLENNIKQGGVDEPAVRATVQRLFDAMRSADSTQLRALFAENAQLKTLVPTKTQAAMLREESVESFIRAVGMPRLEVWDEQIFDVEVRIDGEFAMAWMKYEFYINKTFSHCGVNLFQLLKQDGTWKIFSVTDTRRKSPCEKRTDAQK